MRSAAKPVNVLILLALIEPEVWPLRLLRAEAARVVSLRMTASSPRPLIPDES